MKHKMKRPMILGLAAVAAVAGAAVFMAVRPPAGPGAVPDEARALVEVAWPALSPAAEAGHAAFLENCAACHGTRADGRDGLGPPLVHKIYEPGHHGDMSIVRAVRLGVTAHHWGFGNMAPLPGVRDDQIVAIITFLREVQRANGIF